MTEYERPRSGPGAPRPRAPRVDVEDFEGWVEVFASPRGTHCRERALVLHTQGIPFHRTRSRGLERLLVPRAYGAAALAELSSYESENRDWPPAQPPPALRAGAGRGVAGYVVLLGLCWAVTESATLGFPWHEAGVAHAASIREGQWWRAITALTLHTGPVHLLSNLVFGSFFGMLVAWSHGSGLGWLTVLLAGILGNLGNAWLQDPAHLSVGASTAVFGAVGVLAGSEWRRRHLLRERRLRIAAPILMGLLVLALHGVPEESEGIDVSAHALGLAAGIALGALLPWFTARGGADGRAQRLCALLAVATVVLGWTLALVA